MRCVSSVVQPQEGAISATSGETELPEGDAFRIAKRLSKRHRGLLKAISDDWARGTNRELKCQPSPPPQSSRMKSVDRLSGPVFTQDPVDVFVRLTRAGKRNREHRGVGEEDGLSIWEP